MNVDDLEVGSRVKMEAVGTVIHVHSNGRADIQWENYPSENSVDVRLLTAENSSERE